MKDMMTSDLLSSMYDRRIVNIGRRISGQLSAVPTAKPNTIFNGFNNVSSDIHHLSVRAPAGAGSPSRSMIGREGEAIIRMISAHRHLTLSVS